MTTEDAKMTEGRLYKVVSTSDPTWGQPRLFYRKGRGVRQIRDGEIILALKSSTSDRIPHAMEHDRENWWDVLTSEGEVYAVWVPTHALIFRELT
jgi:hypothetical protein